ncbi:MAG: LiaI-LiaF-like domain-containing protein [Terriglobia bacterium]
MKCSNHPEIDSLGFCGQCGRALCAECRREVRGMVYCETCLAARLQSPTLPPLLGTDSAANPGLALFLGFIPGVGAIYNGQIVKAIVQVLIFGSLIAIANRVGDPFDMIFGLGAAAFYFYMVIDSYQTAKRKQLGQPLEEWLGLGDFRMNAPIGAALLIGLGVLFLLDNFGIPVFENLGKYWPVVLIVIGVILLQRKMGRGGTPPPSSSSGTGSSSLTKK